MSANQATFPVRVMCRLLGVAASGFYSVALPAVVGTRCG